MQQEEIDNARTILLDLIKKGKEGYYIATLDGAIRRIVPNKIFIKDSGNDIEIERK
jgi:hypothetical protein